MMNNICGVCGCGKLYRHAEDNWYECNNCEELFSVDENGEFQLVTYNEWIKSIYQLDNSLINGYLFCGK